MQPTLENAKLLVTLLAVIKKENSNLKDKLLEELYSALQKDIQNQTGKYLQVEDIENPIPVQVFHGERGLQGARGATGPRGIQGIQGETGKTGDVGVAGPQGEQGIEGPQGARGEKGDKGDTGEAGAKGEQGVEGPQGARGAQGEHGADGVAGVKGDKGDAGVQGPKGDTGEAGAKGEQGVRGLTGERGEQGLPGKDGKDADIKPVEERFQKLYDEFVSQISSQITRMALARGNSGVQVSAGSGEVLLKFLDDVDYQSISTAQDEYVLTYNASTKKWEARESTGGAGGNVTNSYLTSTYVANTRFQSVLANTNAFIATKVNTTTFNSALANTNSYIAANALVERQHLANTNAFIKQQLANTNAYIQSISAGGGSTVSNAPLANGTSLILSNINSQVILKKLRAGSNIEISEANGNIILTATPVSLDYGYLT